MKTKFLIAMLLLFTTVTFAKPVNTNRMKEKVTNRQFQEWENQYGEFYELPVDDKICYLRKPTMNDYKRGFKAMQESEISFAEEMLKALFIGGDREILDQDEYFFPARKTVKSFLEYDDAIITPLKSRQNEIDISGHKCTIRVITREDLKTAERKNPGNKTFVTQEKLFELVCIKKDEAYNNKNNADIRFPLYKALESVQNTKYASLKKFSRKPS